MVFPNTERKSEFLEDCSNGRDNVGHKITQNGQE